MRGRQGGARDADVDDVLPLQLYAGNYPYNVDTNCKTYKSENPAVNRSRNFLRGARVPDWTSNFWDTPTRGHLIRLDL